MRTGDVVVAWPVERTLRRNGRTDRYPRIRYVHRVVLRPGVGGLAVIAQGFGT
jgi:hypothetical protein